jgi:hypothetical protein
MCVVRVKDIVNLRKLLKRFILNHYDELKKTDENNKMFDKENFLEIKGSALNSKLKNELARYLCQGNVLEIYYIHVLNQEVKHYFYEDTSRVFNYVLGLLLKKELENNNLPYDDYLIDIDNRNLKQISINSLEDYLNIELILKKRMIRSLNVEYYDSKDNLMVQVSDFFSNLYFSYLNNKLIYQELVNDLKILNFLKDIYYYPENN